MATCRCHHCCCRCSSEITPPFRHLKRTLILKQRMPGRFKFVFVVKKTTRSSATVAAATSLGASSDATARIAAANKAHGPQQAAPWGGAGLRRWHLYHALKLTQALGRRLLQRLRRRALTCHHLLHSPLITVLGAAVQGKPATPVPAICTLNRTKYLRYSADGFVFCLSSYHG